MVELVQLKGLPQVRPHRGQCPAQVGRQRFAELGLGERELIGGRADPLVRADEGLLRTPGEVGILCGELFLFAFASAPKSSHEPILVSRAPALAEHPLRANGDRRR